MVHSMRTGVCNLERAPAHDENEDIKMAAHCSLVYF